MKEEENLSKWLAGEMPEEELQEFRRTPDFELYQKIAETASNLEVPGFDSDKIYTKVISQPKKEIKVKRLNPWILRVAAIIVLAFGITFGMAYSETYSQSAAAGSIASLELPDHSQVTMNSGSDVHFKKWGWAFNRSVELNGEAFFKVTHGNTFDVKTNLGTVTVLGTQFDVKARGNRFEVECFEGRVWIKSGNFSTKITKGQIVVLEGGKPVVASASPSMTPLWMNHEIRIISMPFSEILKEISRTYNVKIDSQVNSNQRFTGTLPQNNLKNAMSILGDVYEFTPKTNDKNQITLMRK